MDDCIFCKVIAGALPSYKVYEDDRVVAFLDIHPVQPGHTLVIPKKHVDMPFELDDDSYGDLFLKTKRLVGPIRRAMGSQRVGLIIEGFQVSHAHIKLIPISAIGDLAQSNARAATPEELAATAQKIRAEVGKEAA